MIQQESRLKPRQQGAELLKDVFDIDAKVTFTQVITGLDGVEGDEAWDELGAKNLDGGEDNG